MQHALLCLFVALNLMILHPHALAQTPAAKSASSTPPPSSSANAKPGPPLLKGLIGNNFLLVKPVKGDPTHVLYSTFDMEVLKAAARGDLPALGKYLDKGFDVNAKFTTGKLAEMPFIHLAIEMQSPALLEFLLKRGADANQTLTGGDFRQLPALHMAAYYGSVAMLDALLKAGAKVNAEWAGGTPLDVALANKQAEATKYLQSAGGKSVRAVPK